MGDLHWYKRDPRAALSGFACLTLEECGAYNIVLELIYIHDGALDDDEHFIAGWLRSDVRVWRRLRKRLIDLDKLYVHGGKLRNGRADKEVNAAQHRVLSAIGAGNQSWAKRVAKSKLIKDLGLTVVQRPFELSTTREDITTSESGTAREVDRGKQGEHPSVTAMRERRERAKRARG